MTAVLLLGLAALFVALPAWEIRRQRRKRIRAAMAGIARAMDRFRASLGESFVPVMASFTRTWADFGAALQRAEAEEGPR